MEAYNRQTLCHLLFTLHVNANVDIKMLERVKQNVLVTVIVEGMVFEPLSSMSHLFMKRLTFIDVVVCCVLQQSTKRMLLIRSLTTDN